MLFRIQQYTKCLIRDTTVILMLVAQYLHKYRHVTESCTAGKPCLLFVTVVSFVTQLVCSYPEESLVMQGIAELPVLLNYSCVFSTQVKRKHSSLMGRHSIKLLCNVAFYSLLTQKKITSVHQVTYSAP